LALLGWLIFRPGILSATILAIFEAFGLIMNLISIANFDPNSGSFKALLVHILLRFLIIGCGMAFAFKKFRQPTLVDAVVDDS
jgi:hypothetical protein